jgi:hypothetical protein
MFLKSSSLLLAAALMAAPMTAAMAQQNNPAGNMGSNRSVTASPGTADSMAAAVINTRDSSTNTTGTGNYGSSAMNKTAPGATGHTVVPGTTSSQANSSTGTMQQKSGAMTGDGK